MKLLIIILGIPLIFFLIIFIEGYIATTVTLAPFTNPSSEPVFFGEGKSDITYVVLGDSTAAGQGAEYSKGIAVQSAMHLSKNNKVKLINLGVSGAKTADVLEKQLPQMKETIPDIVLISVGANDVTHATALSSIEKDLAKIVEELQEKNCKVKIVLTGSPAMETTRLFAQPLRFVSGLQSRRVNTVFDKVIAKYNLTKAPIAEKTKPFFLKDDSLFASDMFHPNEKGYAVWVKVINEAMDTSFKKDMSSCKITF